ncbi:MAG: membrane dipeptidase [Clostridia bacterium]|nr:membrane dipeptidase [Clostridia bacterium]
MKLFDLHCDTIGECHKQKASLRKNNLNVSLEKGQVPEDYTQVFAIWIPDELRKEKAVKYFDEVCDFYESELHRNKDLIVHCNSLPESEKRIKSILAVEGGAALGGDISGLYHLYDRGVRVLTLTWNAENEIASGAFCEKGGLTEFGKKVINKSEILGMVVDVSHLNRQSFFDVAENSTKPFIASHSNPDTVENYYGKKRNLTDEQIDIIKNRGGLIGLNFCADFFDVDGKSGVEAFKAHLSYLLERGCEDIISIGSDFDGCTLTSGIESLSSMESVFESLLSSGFSEDILKGVFYRNAKRFFSKMLTE